MKKIISSFLIITLIIATIFSLGACKKEDILIDSPSNSTVDEIATTPDETTQPPSSETLTTEATTITTTVPTETTIPETTVCETESFIPETTEPATTVTKPTSKPTQTVEKNSNLSNIKNTGTTVTGYGNITDKTKLNELENVLDNYYNNISIIAYSLDGERALSYNTNQGYFSACTIKIGYILHCCKTIEKDNINLNTKLTYQEHHYHGGSGDIQYQPYGTQYTIKELINKALTISDNVAYEMLLDYFGLTDYNKMIGELGCDSLYLDGMWAFDAKAKDIAIIWNEVNNYFNTNTELAKTFKKACTNTPFNYGTLEIKEDYSHKSGDNFGYYAAYHDAGIVWHNKKPYIFVVLTYSEGTWYDETNVNKAMGLVYDIMTA